MQPLSRSNRELGDGSDFKAVVVGSGYGGAVAASRLAAKGWSVCVLERGRERLLGDYPDTAGKALTEMQVHGRHLDIGAPTGLFDFRIGDDMSVLVGSGLGGTSQINANVMMEPPPTTFGEGWPAALQVPGVLAECYDKARQMLGVNVPSEEPVVKFGALARAGAAVGAAPSPSPVAVAFTECTHCGNCVSGCNQGAKNTVLMNYLPAAVAAGAQVFTEVQVDRVTLGATRRWRVHARATGPDGSRPLVVEGDVVVLAAGALGSTEILTRSAMAGLPTSREIGRHFSGNGDFLGVAYDGEAVVNAVGRPNSGTLAAVGPTISGTIDLTDERGAIIQDGAIPGALAPFLPAVLPVGAALFGPDPGANAALTWLRRLAGAVQGPYKGPTARTLTLLLTSTDDHDGVLKFERGRFVVSWPAVGCRPSVGKGNELLGEAAEGLGATYVPGPWWVADRRLVTVHPLGGCIMADSGQRGVVDHLGRVFTGRGKEVYAGLHVLDGSIVPRPLGVNPALTITALAERASAALVGDGPPAPPGAPSAVREPVDVERRVPEPVVVPDPSDKPGLEWDETLEGTLDWRGGPHPRTGLVLRLTVRIEDLEAMLEDPARPARITGEVDLPAVSLAALPVEAGHFQLFVTDPEDRVDTRQMRYRIDVDAGDEGILRIEGHKSIRDDPGFDSWPDLTTLPVTVRRSDGTLLGKGSVRLGVTDVAALALSIRVHNETSPWKQALLKAKFLRTFGVGVLTGYGKALATPWEFRWMREATPTLRKRRPPLLPQPKVISFVEGQGWVEGPSAPGEPSLRLRHFAQQSSKGSVLLAPGFAMRAKSYQLETTEENLTEHLHRAGYDVWLFDWRASFDLPSARSSFDLDAVALEDWPRAVEEVRQRTDNGPVHLLGHCMGSTTALMAKAAGMEGVRSIICSQNTLHLHMQWFSRFLAASPLVQLVEGIGFDHIAPPESEARRSDGSHAGREGFPKGTDPAAVALDLLYRLNPLRKGERCGSPMCRWAFAYFGPTHRHERIDNSTHVALKGEFGPANLVALRHIARMVTTGLAVDAHGEASTYLRPENLGIPILFLAGEDNGIFLASGARETYTWLTTANPGVPYELQLLKRYGHLDALVGRHAHEDVFPLISDFLDRN